MQKHFGTLSQPNTSSETRTVFLNGRHFHQLWLKKMYLVRVHHLLKRSGHRMSCQLPEFLRFYWRRTENALNTVNDHFDHLDEVAEKIVSEFFSSEES